MLAVFKDDEIVIVCEVDSEGQPKNCEQYFEPGAYVREDFDLQLVEAPVSIQRGGLKVEEERRLTPS